MQLITEVAQRFGWSANWTRDVSRGALALVCLTAGKTLCKLSDGDFAAFAQALAEAPSACRDAWMRNSARAFSLHQTCYELRICQQPPRMAPPGKATIAERLQAIIQPPIRRQRCASWPLVDEELADQLPGKAEEQIESFLRPRAAVFPHPAIARLRRPD